MANVPTVIYVRHGRSSANTSGTLAGWMPGVFLDEAGEVQADGVGQRIAAASLPVVEVVIGLCLVLIPKMGITGAAVAWAVAVSMRCILAVVQTRFTMRIVSFGPAAVAVAVANLVCFAVPLILLGRVVDVGPGILALALLVCVPAYALALWLSRHWLMLSVLRGLLQRGPTPVTQEDVADA